MSKRQITIDDDMQERIDGALEDVINELISYLEENKDVDEWNTIYQNHLADNVHEVVDSATPIYYKNIDDLYYLYGSECEEAYKNAGCYTEPPDNYRQVAIYFYIEQELWEKIRELEEEFDNIISDDEIEENEKKIDNFINHLKEVKESL